MKYGQYVFEFVDLPVSQLRMTPNVFDLLHGIYYDIYYDNTNLFTIPFTMTSLAPFIITSTNFFTMI